MKIWSYSTGVLAVSAAFLVSCNLNSSDDEKTEVSDYESLPACSPYETTSGVSLLDEKVFVEGENAHYLCSDTGWVIVGVSKYEDLPNCPASRNRNVGLNVLVDSDTAYFICTNAGWRLSDSLGGQGSEVYPEMDSLLMTGEATALGPFEKGSRITVQELVRDARTGAYSLGKPADSGVVSETNGGFVIPNVTLYSSYMLVTVKGLFMDALTGELSEDSLELTATAAASGYVRVNLFSHLQGARARTLIDQGYRISEAMELSEKELLSVFKLSDVDVLQADAVIGVLLRSNLSSKDFIGALKSLTEDFAEDGIWDDEEAYTALADFAFNLENLKIRDEETDEVLLKPSDYRRNLEKFGLVDIYDYESLLYRVWSNAYALGGCGNARWGAVVQNQNPMSDSASAYFFCENFSWRIASDFERDTTELGDAPDGELREGHVNNKKWYVYDTTGFDQGIPTRWKEPDSIVLVIGHSCTDEEKVKYTVVATEDDDGNDNYYACVNRSWVGTSEAAYRVGEECNANLANELASYKNSNKETEYVRCSEIYEGYWQWTPTTEINYTLRDEECALYEIFTYKKKSYVCVANDPTDFREASAQEAAIGDICREELNGMMAQYEDENGATAYAMCMDYGIWMWSSIDEITYKVGRTCSENNAGDVGFADEVAYTCGCLDYTTIPVTVTSVGCSYVSWVTEPVED